MPAPLFWTYLPQHLLVNLLNVAWYTLRGQGRAVLRAKRDAVLGLPGILRSRREVQRGRTVGSLELRRLMAGGLGPYTTGVKRALAARRADPGETAGAGAGARSLW
jgi:hypothetical protein